MAARPTCPTWTCSAPATPLLDPTFLLSSARFHEVINQIKAEYDLILFDGPAVLAVPDTLLLAGTVDSILLLIDARTTSQRALLRAKNLLTEQGKGEVIGTVFNRAMVGPDQLLLSQDSPRLGPGRGPRAGVAPS